MPDLRVLRSSVSAFAEEVGRRLTSWQAEALALEVRTTVIVAPRQSGKSRSLAVLAVWWAFRRGGQRVLLLSAGEDASRRLLAEVRAIVNGSPLLAGSVLDEQAGLVTLSNGSEIRSVPASERQVRGWTVDLLLADEAALVPDDLLLGAALPTTAARPEARVVLASSALTAAGAFFDHAVRGEQGSEHVRTFRWALADAEWISPSVIAAARESMTEARFRAEYEGVFASGADALFTRAAIDRATADYVPTGLGLLRGPARLLGGVDWGATTDRSALVAGGRLPAEGREAVFGVACARRWPAGAPLEDVIAEIAGSPAHFDTLALETNGLGMPCAQSLARRLTQRPGDAGGGQRPPSHALVDVEAFDAMVAGQRPWPGAAQAGPVAGWRTRPLFVHTTAELKAAAYSSLRLLMDQGRLVLPASAEDLLRELLMLRVDLTPTGVERIEASSGHDDLADALMLASCPHRGRDGRWATLLAYYAERALPAAAGQGGRGQPMVKTGGGVAVPRVPAWQSVRGSQVTVPAGADGEGERVSPVLQRLRDSVAAAMNVNQKEAERRE
jgi:hypothetical protein